MHHITVVALGPGSGDFLTLGALKQLKKAKTVVLRTQKHGAVPLLMENGILFESLDDLYLKSDNFDAFSQAASEHLLALAQKGAVTYAVSDPAGDVSVALLKAAMGDSLRILPGVPLSAPFVTQAALDRPFLVASAVNAHAHNAQQPLVVYELDSKALAGEVKLKLLPKYGPHARVVFFPPGEQARRKGVEISLVDLDRQPRYNHTAGFVVFPTPLLEKEEFDPEDLLAIMHKLRAPDGCPWDKEQTHQSLAKHLVEEANEAFCALLEEDWDSAADELGDVFLQLAFHAVVGEEHATFTWEDMLRAICQKLIRRHPHIFGDQRINTAQEVVDTWERIKKQERGGAGPGHRMLEVPKGLAPLMRAEKVQKLAAKAGFDWENARDALEKVPEEALELRQAMDSGVGMADELGDLLFSCVNVARLMDISADQSLHSSIEKFVKRFIWMENSIKNDEKDWNLLTSQQIGVYWERSKAEA